MKTLEELKQEMLDAFYAWDDARVNTADAASDDAWDAARGIWRNARVILDAAQAAYNSRVEEDEKNDVPRMGDNNTTETTTD